MPNVFLISDTHFGHSNILSFKNGKGDPLRVFSNIDEMDEHLITKWNSVVKSNDKVYHLGDVGFRNFTYIESIFNRLNGTKVLIRGNHDNFKVSQYVKLFKDVRATHTLNKFLLSHIPVHEQSLSRWIGNIHGHLHSNNLSDERYLNVSVEQLQDYTPISFEEIKSLYTDRGIYEQDKK